MGGIFVVTHGNGHGCGNAASNGFSAAGRRAVLIVRGSLVPESRFQHPGGAFTFGTDAQFFPLAHYLHFGGEVHASHVENIALQATEPGLNMLRHVLGGKRAIIRIANNRVHHRLSGKNQKTATGTVNHIKSRRVGLIPCPNNLKFRIGRIGEKTAGILQGLLAV